MRTTGERNLRSYGSPAPKKTQRRANAGLFFHPRDILEDEDVGWTVTECAQRLGMARNTLSRLLNGHIGISPRLALAMERIGWGDADHWMRVQAAYELALARKREDAA